MSAPPEVFERLARRLKLAGVPTAVVVSVCHTERGALRVAKRYPLSAIERSADGTTWTVWARRGD